MSSKTKPDSKASQARAAVKTLKALLRTPKTRSGLVAAVARGKISRNFVFGWLAEARRDGTVTAHKSGGVVMFQMTAEVVVEVPAVSEYPSWLDPRSLPAAIGRTVVVDGAVINVNGKTKK